MKYVVHCKKEAFDVYIGRPSPFGNPYVLQTESDRKKVIDMYREYFYERVEIDPEFRSKVLKLRGKVLGCYCAPKPCHGDVIVEWLSTHDN